MKCTCCRCGPPGAACSSPLSPPPQQCPSPPGVGVLVCCGVVWHQVCCGVVCCGTRCVMVCYGVLVCCGMMYLGEVWEHYGDPLPAVGAGGGLQGVTAPPHLGGVRCGRVWYGMVAHKCMVWCGTSRIQSPQ